LLRVPLDTGDESVGKRVLLAAVVLGLNDHDLLSGVSSTGDDGLRLLVFRCHGILEFSLRCAYHSADLEDYATVSILNAQC
jgi:hypothetical protein